MSPSASAAEPAAPASRRIRVLIIMLPLLVILAAALPALRAPLEWRDGDALVRTIGDGRPAAKVSIPLVFPEGGDVSHESSHIFDALSSVKGTSTARLSSSPPSVEVTFDPAVVSEATLRATLAAAGYGGQPQ